MDNSVRIRAFLIPCIIAEQEARQLIVQQCHFCMYIYIYIYIYMYAVTLGSARAYGGKYEL